MVLIIEVNISDLKPVFHYYKWNNKHYKLFEDTVYITKRNNETKFNGGKDYWGFMMPTGDDVMVKFIGN